MDIEIEHYVASNNMTTRRHRRAWEAIFFILLVTSVCMAACAVCGAIGVWR